MEDVEILRKGAMAIYPSDKLGAVLLLDLSLLGDGWCRSISAQAMLLYVRSDGL